MRREPRGLLEGVSQGGEELVKGFLEGLLGWQEYVQHSELENSMHGTGMKADMEKTKRMMKVSVKGILGLAIKPSVGVLDALGKIILALRNSTHQVGRLVVLASGIEIAHLCASAQQ